MAILVSTTPGLSRSEYEQVAERVIEHLKATPGFVSHYAYEAEEGITVVEIWESGEQHDAWFDTTIKPHLPEGATPQKHDLVNRVHAE